MRRVSVLSSGFRMRCVEAIVESAGSTGTITKFPVMCLTSVATQVCGRFVESVSENVKLHWRVVLVTFCHHVKGRTAASVLKPFVGSAVVEAETWALLSSIPSSTRVADAVSVALTCD